MRLLKRFAIGTAISIVVLLCVLGGLVALSRPSQPPALHSVTDPFAKMDVGDMPAVARYRARDGVQLSYRLYPGRG